MSAEWDYIVVGAGHNGLSAASAISKAGNSVLVVDHRPIIGGLSASHPYLDNSPDHHLSIGAMDDALMAPSSIVAEFGLKSRGYNPIPLDHPYGWMNEDGDTLLLFKDFNRTVSEIRRHSTKDAQTYQDVRSTIDFLMGSLDTFGAYPPDGMPRREILSAVLKVATNKQIRRTLSRMLSTSAFEMILETFESEAMRGLWAFWSCMFAPATTQAGGVYLSGFGNVHRTGIFRPQGGMSGLMRAFERFITDHGGEIRLNARVAEIVVDSANRATGVRLASGEVLGARHAVVASCAPQVALGQLLPKGTLPRTIEEKLSFIPANSVEIAPFKIDVAAGSRLSYPRAQAKRDKIDGADTRKTTFMSGTIEQHMAQHEAARRGEDIDFVLPLYFSILSGPDASIAPEGGDVLYLYANSPLKPREGWAAKKAEFGERVMASAAQFIDGLDSARGRIETCPDDFIERFSAPRATYFHVDMIPSRLGMNRPGPGLGGYATPVDGLYLASAGSHPTGGVCGLPGKLGAERAMRDAARRR